MAKTKTKGTAKTVSDTPVPQPITIRSTNPKIMADNILKLEESIKAADVSANPSGTAEDTLLTTIGIDGKKYDLGPSAENTSYDNTDSGLTATDTQAAVDEVAGIASGTATNLSALLTTISYTHSYTASASGSANWNVLDDIQVPTGYTALGFIQFNTGNGNILPCAITLADSSFGIYIKNMRSDQAIEATFEGTVLCKKNLS